MADLRNFITFYAQILGNGTDASTDINFATDPVTYAPNSGALLGSLFSGLPVAVSNVTSSGATISGSPSYSALTKTLSVNFTSTPASGAIVYVTGYAEY